jgi:hypothetical protein
MGRPKGSKNKIVTVTSPKINKGGQNATAPKTARPKPPGGSVGRVAAKPVGLSVGEKIAYQKPLGGTEQVTIEGIETRVDKISAKDLTRPETVLYLSNGKWMRGTDYIEFIKGKES